jgi:glycosyltransferase involved in cell wall biosynthesis
MEFEPMNHYNYYSTMKPKLVIVNTDISSGGLGKYTVQLSSYLKPHFEVYGIVTHDPGGRFNDFIKQCIRTYEFSQYNKYIRYIALLLRIWILRPRFILCNYNAPLQYLLPFFPFSKKIHIIHNNTSDFYRVASINARFVSKWIAPSKGIAVNFNVYTKARFSDKIVVIPHSVQPAPVSCLQKKFNPFVVTYIGALYEHKGVKLLPQIIKEVIKSIHNVKFNILGDGALMEWLITTINKEGLNDFVTIMGNVSDSEVDSVLTNSHILLFPTRVEAFGLVIAEALVHGAVPVVTHLEGITDSIVEDRLTGFLVDNNFPEGFSESIIRLCNDELLLGKMSIDGYNDALQRFSVSRMTSDYIKCIED